ncbi:hypothetical protein HK098_003358 [Nowakowskiella sp. JEL0407]|nr:hypothetical protein HK098_003358 [Nowakowskiella sp. JEL0407]
MVFPSVRIRFEDLHENKSVFVVGFRHNQTWFRLGFAELSGSSQLFFGIDDDGTKHQKITDTWKFRTFKEDKKALEADLDAKADIFMKDATKLLDGFTPVDQSLFYHPSACVLPNLNTDLPSPTSY